MDIIQNFIDSFIGQGIVNFLLALLILIIGWIVARIIASITRRLLKRTNLDNRLADQISEAGERKEFSVEDFIAKVIFWVIMLFVLVAFFSRLGLEGIAQPIQVFLQQLTVEYLPRLGAAALLLVIAWLLATVLRFLVLKAASLLKLDERMAKYAAMEEEEKVSFSKPFATAVFWFVFLLFLPSVLTALGIQNIAQPVQSVFNQIFSFIPTILAAALTVLIGVFIARLIRQIVNNLLKAIGTDRFGERVGMPGDRSLSELIGRIIYIFLLLVIIITALNQLNIEALSGPTTMMLTTIVNAIPGIVGAAMVLVITYAIARLVADLVRDLLTGIGFNKLPEKLGLSWSAKSSPAEWMGWLILIVIMLFAATAAFELLGSAFLVNTLNVFIGFLSRVFLAVVVFAFGLYFANLAYNVIGNTGINQASTVGRAAQIAIIVFASAMALRQIGVAEDIINLAFGVILGTIGVALAIAFGLGSREVAGREVERLLSKMREPKEGSS